MTEQLNKTLFSTYEQLLENVKFGCGVSWDVSCLGLEQIRGFDYFVSSCEQWVLWGIKQLGLLREIMQAIYVVYNVTMRSVHKTIITVEEQ